MFVISIIDVEYFYIRLLFFFYIFMFFYFIFCRDFLLFCYFIVLLIVFEFRVYNESLIKYVGSFSCEIICIFIEDININFWMCIFISFLIVVVFLEVGRVDYMRRLGMNILFR